ncbi:MAG TPA: DHA2 family efflux MFS transporter permease subunit [Xanthobacteraceae bacterium]|jgi:DHA2 family multidrug resistance protein|nr:DHA2 family efflux MFS transporter permease subunit [Xanthobacteraceae bacterium]
MNAPSNAADRIDPRRMMAFIAMCFGMFMALLDIQIVSASLAEIQAGLAASSDEIPWVQTAYLMAEVVAIPLSGFLSRALGTRTLFALSSAGFTLASVMCGITSSIDGMIVWRALQGFIGGGMIPTVFAAAFTVFPPSRQSMVSPIIGLIATMAPTVGPTVGGYLTDAMSWHWLFFINVIPGIAVTAAALALIDFDKPDYSLLNRFDWWGLIAMAGFLGALEYVLEEGPRYYWLEDDTIAYAAAFSALSAAAFFYRALTAPAPIVDLRAYGDRNFAIGSMFSFVLGIGLYGLTYLYPVYLAQVRGYNALMIGETMFVSGLAMFASAPIVGRLVAKVDPRFVLMGGFLLFAAGTLQMYFVTKDWDFWELLWPQIFRGVGLMCAIVPVTNTALGTLPPDRVKNASGLFNLSRNLGGAIGLAAINTMFNNRMDLHLARLHDSVSWSRGPAIDMLANLTARFHDFGSNAQAMALKEMSLMARLQASVMSFADIFLLLTILFVALAALGIVMRRPAAPAGAAADAH